MPIHLVVDNQRRRTPEDGRYSTLAAKRYAGAFLAAVAMYEGIRWQSAPGQRNSDGTPHVEHGTTVNFTGPLCTTNDRLPYT